MKTSIIKLFIFSAAMLVLGSCSSYKNTIREPNARVELTKSDFTLSEQVSAEAITTKILGIDWARLTLKKTAEVQGGGLASAYINIANIPVIGNIVYDKTTNYALYELMAKYPGYDIVFYPQYETKVVKPIGLNIYKITTVKVTARLAKFK